MTREEVQSTRELKLHKLPVYPSNAMPTIPEICLDLRNKFNREDYPIYTLELVNDILSILGYLIFVKDNWVPSKDEKYIGMDNCILELINETIKYVKFEHADRMQRLISCLAPDYALEVVARMTKL